MWAPVPSCPESHLSVDGPELAVRGTQACFAGRRKEKGREQSNLDTKSQIPPDPLSFSGQNKLVPVAIPISSTFCNALFLPDTNS